jgi:hypothetical protein
VAEGFVHVLKPTEPWNCGDSVDSGEGDYLLVE